MKENNAHPARSKAERVGEKGRVNVDPTEGKTLKGEGNREPQPPTVDHLLLPRSQNFSDDRGDRQNRHIPPYSLTLSGGVGTKTYAHEHKSSSYVI